MAKRTYPNDYFAWYNNDDKLAIVCLATSTDSSSGTSSGEYDTYSDSTVANGLRIHYHAKYA